jgi:poly(A) polymerase
MNSYFEHPVLKLITTIAIEEDLELYVVGGYVRDAILQRPSSDIDIVVIGNGIDLAKKVAKASTESSVVSIFKNFGTAMIKFGNYEVEFVGARKESYRANSRKPIVENGSLEEDQKRRDFTINAMAWGLGKVNYGKLIDPFNGLEDLEKKLIRTPLEPMLTFSDDPAADHEGHQVRDSA